MTELPAETKTCDYGHVGAYVPYRRGSSTHRRCGTCHRMKEQARRQGLPALALLEAQAARSAPVVDPDDYGHPDSDVRAAS